MVRRVATSFSPVVHPTNRRREGEGQFGSKEEEVRDARERRKTAKERLTTLEIKVPILDMPPKSRTLLVQVLDLLKLVINQALLLLLKLLLAHLLNRLLEGNEEGLDPVLEKLGIVLTLNEDVEADGSRVGSTSGRDEVSELFLGSEGVEAGFSSDLGEEGGERSKGVGGGGADLAVVLDSGVGVGFVGEREVPDVLGGWEEENETKGQRGHAKEKGRKLEAHIRGGKARARTPSPSR